jgi:pimeloyl-ACP methyl ester carboxylesterase
MAWLVLASRANETARLALVSDARVTVDDGGPVIAFRPTGRPETTGVIFYPGAMVEPAAYAPLCRRIAERGYPVFIVKLPLGSAPLRSQVAVLFRRTEETMRSNPAVKRWVVSGHSRGGALAGRFGKEHGREVSGLVLVATSHPKDSEHDLSHARFPVLKVYGSNDGLASEAEVVANRKYLPADAVLYRVEGGNHAQFADYRWQLGDSRASISREDQQALTLGAILRFLRRIG